METGYVITHPHEPYEDVISFHVNKFCEGDLPWQVQSYAQGALVESDYFASEIDALRWIAREAVIIACVAKMESVS